MTHHDEEFGCFQIAARRARELASLHGTDIFVRSTDSRWIISAPTVDYDERDWGEGRDRDDELDDDLAAQEADAHSDAQSETAAELSCDEGDWERSNEHGWAYSDEDE